jgi:hypothetical protein
VITLPLRLPVGVNMHEPITKGIWCRSWNSAVFPFPWFYQVPLMFLVGLLFDVVDTFGERRETYKAQDGLRNEIEICSLS